MLYDQLACRGWFYLLLLKIYVRKKDSIAFFRFISCAGVGHGAGAHCGGVGRDLSVGARSRRFTTADRTEPGSALGEVNDPVLLHIISPDFCHCLLKPRMKLLPLKMCVIRDWPRKKKKKAVSSRRLTFRMSARFKQFQKTEISSSERFRGDSAKYKRHSQGKYVGTCWFLFLSELHLSPTTILIFI